VNPQIQSVACCSLSRRSYKLLEPSPKSHPHPDPDNASQRWSSGLPTSKRAALYEFRDATLQLCPNIKFFTSSNSMILRLFASLLKEIFTVEKRDYSSQICFLIYMR
jgi:hypothetical protein